MKNLWKDIRFGVRMLANKPAVTIIAVIALALGIGASTAIFSVVNTVLLQALPYPNGNRLVTLWEKNRPRARDRNVISGANFFDWREQNHSFDDIAVFVNTSINLTGLGDPEEVTGMVTSTSFFDVLGTRPLLGRTLCRAMECPARAMWPCCLTVSGSDISAVIQTLSVRPFHSMANQTL